MLYLDSHVTPLLFLAEGVNWPRSNARKLNGLGREDFLLDGAILIAWSR
jgi:hypothetical protein